MINRQSFHILTQLFPSKLLWKNNRSRKVTNRRILKFYRRSNKNKESKQINSHHYLETIETYHRTTTKIICLSSMKGTDLQNRQMNLLQSKISTKSQKQTRSLPMNSLTSWTNSSSANTFRNSSSQTMSLIVDPYYYPISFIPGFKWNKILPSKISSLS